MIGKCDKCGKEQFMLDECSNEETCMYCIDGILIKIDEKNDDADNDVPKISINQLKQAIECIIVKHKFSDKMEYIIRDEFHNRFGVPLP